MCQGSLRALCQARGSMACVRVMWLWRHEVSHCRSHVRRHTGCRGACVTGKRTQILAAPWYAHQDARVGAYCHTRSARAHPHARAPRVRQFGRLKSMFVADEQQYENCNVNVDRIAGKVRTAPVTPVDDS